MAMLHSLSFPDRAVWTVDHLEQLPNDGNRYEILHGELLVTPMPTWGASRRRRAVEGAASTGLGGRSPEPIHHTFSWTPPAPLPAGTPPLEVSFVELFGPPLDGSA